MVQRKFCNSKAGQCVALCTCAIPAIDFDPEPPGIISRQLAVAAPFTDSPHTHIVTVSLYLRLHPPDYSNNARLSRLLGLEFTSTCCACCGAGVRLGRLEELQGGAPSHRARIAGRTHTRCCAAACKVAPILTLVHLPVHHPMLACAMQLYILCSADECSHGELDQQCWCRRPFTTQGDHKVPAKD